MDSQPSAGAAASYPAFPSDSPRVHLHVSGRMGARVSDLEETLRRKFGGDIDVGPRLVSKGWWYREVSSAAWQAFAGHKVTSGLKSLGGVWASQRFPDA